MGNGNKYGWKISNLFIFYDNERLRKRVTVVKKITDR